MGRVNTSLQFYLENGILADEGQEKETINGDDLTSIAYVNIIPPDARHLKNTDCHIYGDISFRVGDTEVILFSRKRDNPDHLFLSDLNEGSRLSLSDHHESNLHGPLPAVSASKPLYVKMKLYEKEGSGEEDVLIADAEHIDPIFLDVEEDWYYFLCVPGKQGFRFNVSYSVVFGARAKVDVKIKEEERAKKRVLFSGEIVAYQYLEDLCPNFDNGISVTRLGKIHDSHPVTLNVGESIPLTRRFVVVPMRREMYLGICISPVISEEGQDRGEQGVVDHYLYFPLRQFNEGIFFANKDLPHTKHFKHSSGVEFHVSVTFCRAIVDEAQKLGA